MQSNLCCPECGSHEIHTMVDMGKIKKSTPAYIRRRCRNCGTNFVAPGDLRTVINDIQYESKRSFKTNMTISLALLAMGVVLSLNSLIAETKISEWVVISIVVGLAVIGMIASVIIRLAAHKKLFKLECEMEECCGGILGNK